MQFRIYSFGGGGCEMLHKTLCKVNPRINGEINSTGRKQGGLFPLHLELGRRLDKHIFPSLLGANSKSNSHTQNNVCAMMLANFELQHLPNRRKAIEIERS